MKTSVAMVCITVLVLACLARTHDLVVRVEISHKIDLSPILKKTR